jgi:hypothetical protein
LTAFTIIRPELFATPELLTIIPEPPLIFPEWSFLQRRLSNVPRMYLGGRPLAFALARLRRLAQC